MIMIQLSSSSSLNIPISFLIEMSINTTRTHLIDTREQFVIDLNNRNDYISRHHHTVLLLVGLPDFVVTHAHVSVFIDVSICGYCNI